MRHRDAAQVVAIEAMQEASASESLLQCLMCVISNKSYSLEIISMFEGQNINVFLSLNITVTALVISKLYFASL